jgi:diguanylate cyclase (GGDEF)-like protein
MTSNKPTKLEIHDLVEEINKDLDSFIKNRIQNGILSDRDWSSLFQEPENKWCWEILSCNKEDCPVRSKNNYRCWLVAGTLCGGMVQGGFAKKFGNCVTCEVYRQYHERPIRGLYENINALISHMSDEALEFSRKASIDALTGLLNRARFDEVIAHEVKRSQRMDDIPLTLVVFDLDDFKKINDDGGHLIGDYYLVEFAAILREVTRDTDFVFRTGGDEFTVLLVGEQENGELPYVSRVQEAIARWNANKDRPHSYTMAASTGAACLNDFKYNVDKCITQADERMYQNKRERKAEDNLDTS